MRFAFIIDDYLPDSTRVGAKMFHELAVEFKRNGHDIVVITPSHLQSTSLVQDVIDNVLIWRFRNGLIKDTSKLRRAINESMLSINAWNAIKREIKKYQFDGIIYYSPSIFFGDLISKLKKECKCPAYLVLRDFFPQWAIDAGMIKPHSLIERYFRHFERKNYDVANTIGVMSEKNRDVFFEKNSSKYVVKVLRNWAKCSPYKNSFDNSYRDRLGLNDKVIFFYGGNIGHAQDMANLMRLAREMQHHKDAHFLFVGQGDEVELIKQLAKDWNLKNFSFLPSVTQQEFKKILSEVDIGLFSLAANHSAHNFPGKLLGYMVESLPILGSVNQGNDLANIVNINNAGLIYENGDDKSLLNAAEKLFLDAKYRLELGRGALNLLHKEFSVTSAYQTIIETFDELKNESYRQRVNRETLFRGRKLDS